MKTLNPLKVNAFHKGILVVKPYKNQDLHIPIKGMELEESKLGKELNLVKTKDYFIISQKEVNMKSHYGMFSMHHFGNISFNVKETNYSCEMVYYLNTNNNGSFFSDTVVIVDEPKTYKEINIKLKTNQILHIVSTSINIDGVNANNQFIKEINYILERSETKLCVGAENIFYHRKYLPSNIEENHSWITSVSNTQRLTHPIRLKLANYVVNLYFDTVDELVYEKFDEGIKRYVLNYKSIKSDTIINTSKNHAVTTVPTKVEKHKVVGTHTVGSYVYQSPTVIVKKVSNPEVAKVKISFAKENSIYMTENVFYKDYLKKSTKWIGWGAEG